MIVWSHLLSPLVRTCWDKNGDHFFKVQSGLAGVPLLSQLFFSKFLKTLLVSSWQPWFCPTEGHNILFRHTCQLCPLMTIARDKKGYCSLQITVVWSRLLLVGIRWDKNANHLFKCRQTWRGMALLSQLLCKLLKNCGVFRTSHPRVKCYE